MNLRASHIEFMGYSIPLKWGALLFCLSITAIACFPVLLNGWVNWDDPYYVLNNALIKNFSFEQIGIFFTTKEVHGNYHPVTLISLAFDYALGGDNPTLYHAHNLALHLANTGLVFIFFRLLSKHVLIAFIVAVLFGIHPMHMESVAWISARKDLLMGFYFLGGLISWFYYLEGGPRKRFFYILSVLALTMSLMSKALAVVFPVVLLLLDFLLYRKIDWKTILEKVPFFVLSIGFGLMAISVQQFAGAIYQVEKYDFFESMLIASSGIIYYITNGIFPVQLAAFHPYPEMETGWPWYFIISFLTVLLGLLVVIIKNRKNRPLLFGVFFFLIAIAPVLQIISVGSAIVAERYTYLPYLGLFYLMALAVNALKEQAWINKKVLTYGVLIYIGMLGVISFNRAQIWENSETLWSDVIDKYPEDFFAYTNRGDHYLMQNELDLAEKDLRISANLNTNFFGTFNSLGLVQLRGNNMEAAVQSFKRAIQIDSSKPQPFINNGITYRELQQFEESLTAFYQAEKLNPSNSMVFIERGMTYMDVKQFDKAILDFSEAIALRPDDVNYYYYRADAYCYNQQFAEGLTDFNKIVLMNPNLGYVYFGRSRAHLSLKNNKQAYIDAVDAEKLGYQLPKGYLDIFTQ